MTERTKRAGWAVLLALLSAGCGSAPVAERQTLSIKGSDTMLILNQRLAEEFMRGHPGIAVTVEGGGTSTGVEAIIGGDAAICAASRPLAPAEVQRIHDRYGTLGVRHLVAQDSLSVWVHPDNPVRNLTLGQLGRIFDGSVTRWSELGGDDREITVVVRPPSSGTFRFFRDRVLRGAPYTGRAVTAGSTAEVVRRVADDPSAIGYGGAAYVRDDVRACAIDGVPPPTEAADGARYPLTRHLVYYTAVPPEGLAREWIDWCQGSSGQSVVAETGYLPLWTRP
ncbi:MAG: PstS family phosphate ABC transporter substrate-binding protein [Thermoanaerobaculales bacterium]|jgi:phosphate transport system substrate-binding protein|nr:PstS family phosphate ABC transporter substrate-binding protein [Thermoanaerobaculales bacterium]